MEIGQIDMPVGRILDMVKEGRIKVTFAKKGVILMALIQKIFVKTCDTKSIMKMLT